MPGITKKPDQTSRPPASPTPACDRQWYSTPDDVLFGVIVLPHDGQFLHVKPRLLQGFDRRFRLRMGGVDTDHCVVLSHGFPPPVMMRDSVLFLRLRWKDRKHILHLDARGAMPLRHPFIFVVLAKPIPIEHERDTSPIHCPHARRALPRDGTVTRRCTAMREGGKRPLVQCLCAGRLSTRTLCPDL
jgi:hypothetical protein